MGLALLVKGGDLFVSAAIRLAEFLRMPRVVVGSTLVSLATTTPELVVSITAGVKGESELALGNALGSCICNVGLILGLTAAFKQIEVRPWALRAPLLAMFGFGALLFAFTIDLRLSRNQGLILVGGGLLYFAFDFLRHTRSPSPAHLQEAAEIQQSISQRLRWFETKSGSIIQFVAGALIVVVGSRLLVDAAVHIAAALGIPSILIGLTIVAIGTSLPELITAVTSSRKAVSDLAVGNVLGANIANLTLIVGTAAIISDVGMSRATQLYNFPALLLIFAVLLWMLLTERKVSRREGTTLLVLYMLYLSGLILLTGALRSNAS